MTTISRTEDRSKYIVCVDFDGVIHSYKNIGASPGLMVNCPNKLYRGVGRIEPADEIRYEDAADCMPWN